MKKSLLRDSLILVTIFGIIWGAFTYFPIFSSESPDFGISIEQEERLGKLIVENLIEGKDTKIASNPKLDSAMHVISKRLTNAIGPTDYEYKIKVIDNPQINAFTLPGGNIFVFSGLINFSEDPEEVAAVLAHEIGHAEKRHVVKKLVKELGVTILFSVLTGGDAVVLKEITRTAASTVFDRGQEKEADDYSFALMERAELNPKALATFFRRVNDEFGGYNEHMEILMTHPNNNSRIKAALEYKLPENFKSKPFNLDWEAVKTSVAVEGK
jgi:beta-barrel assembly-enhancing protease